VNKKSHINFAEMKNQMKATLTYKQKVMRLLNKPNRLMLKGICYASIFLIVMLFSSLAWAQEAAPQDNASPQAVPGLDMSEATIAKGKELFVGRCQSCHAVTEQVVIGPGLKGVLERRELPWLLKWIRNSQALIQSGDPIAVQVYNEYNQTQMTSFLDLSDDDIKAILAYVKSAENQQQQAAAEVTAQTGGGEAAQASGINQYYLMAILIGLVIVLILVLVVLLLIVSLLTRFLKSQNLPEEDLEVVNEKIDLTAPFRSKAFLTMVGVFFLLVVAKAGIDSLMDIGVQTGYAPTQPIAFSHKLHAGKYQIDCQYCHTGVRKGKSANIPSANICMNCHGEIKRGSPEIQKIYAAIEKNEPIKWVRVHNLQDFVYFNHAQHVQVGQIECQQCHGEVEKMEVVQQRSPLTMGWCIDCHRKTVVKAEGNDYYDRLLQFHKNNAGKKPMTVEDIGGLECSKCHY
jgi:mono/diheme cytochrome c family protein